jgi:hypothetical protein
MYAPLVQNWWVMCSEAKAQTLQSWEIRAGVFLQGACVDSGRCVAASRASIYTKLISHVVCTREIEKPSMRYARYEIFTVLRHKIFTQSLCKTPGLTSIKVSWMLLYFLVLVIFDILGISE